MSHTPGPWLLGSAIDSPGMVPVPVYDSAKSDRCIAQVYPWLGADGNPDTQHDANARLIVAAPDLLALAEQYAEECAECEGTGTLREGPHKGEACSECAFIHEVLRKAKP